MALKRVTITIAADLLKRADQEARRLDRSRSWVVADALRAALAEPGAPPAHRVREPAAVYRAPPQADLRLEQLRRDLMLTPEQRVLEAERTHRAGDRLHRGPRARYIRSFASIEDYLEFRRARGDVA